MKEILLLSENNFRNNCNISSNIQSKFVISAIRESQSDYEEIIGSTLYNKLIELVDDDTISDEENEKFKELLDKSQMYLTYNALTKILVISNYHIDNFGISQSKDENLENINLSDTFKLEAYYTNKVDDLAKRLQNYLKQNKDFFKDYCPCEDIKPNLYSAASSSIFLGGVRGKTYSNNCSKHC